MSRGPTFRAKSRSYCFVFLVYYTLRSGFQGACWLLEIAVVFALTSSLGRGVPSKSFTSFVAFVFIAPKYSFHRNTFKYYLMFRVADRVSLLGTFSFVQRQMEKHQFTPDSAFSCVLVLSRCNQLRQAAAVHINSITSEVEHTLLHEVA